MKVVITKDYTEMCKLASRIFAAEITLKPDCVLGLATGSTPVGMYKELVEMYNEHRVDFSQVKTVKSGRVRRSFRRQRSELSLLHEPQSV